MIIDLGAINDLSRFLFLGRHETCRLPARSWSERCPGHLPLACEG